MASLSLSLSFLSRGRGPKLERPVGGENVRFPMTYITFYNDGERIVASYGMWTNAGRGNKSRPDMWVPVDRGTPNATVLPPGCSSVEDAGCHPVLARELYGHMMTKCDGQLPD